MDLNYLFRIFIKLILIINLCMGYKHVKLQSYDLCTTKPIKRILDVLSMSGPKITLEPSDQSAMIIEQIWNSSTLSNIRSDCNFRVSTGKRPPSGFYSLIRKLKFRKDPITGNCYDYIQFSHGNRGSRRFCLDVNTENEQQFDERDDEMRITVHIDNKRPIKEPLELSMVITAHSTCEFNNDFQCDPNDLQSCISSEFVKDGIVNCLKPCNDEDSCLSETIIAEQLSKSNIILSALTSMIFTMLVVGTCLWLCWKYKDCYQSEQNTTRRHSEDVPTIELPSSPVTGSTVNNQASPGDTSPKDLPPSYESLFPER